MFSFIHMKQIIAFNRCKPLKNENQLIATIHTVFLTTPENCLLLTFIFKFFLHWILFFTLSSFTCVSFSLILFIIIFFCYSKVNFPFLNRCCMLALLHFLIIFQSTVHFFLFISGYNHLISFLFRLIVLFFQLFCIQFRHAWNTCDGW